MVSHFNPLDKRLGKLDLSRLVDQAHALAEQHESRATYYRNLAVLHSFEAARAHVLADKLAAAAMEGKR